MNKGNKEKNKKQTKNGEKWTKMSKWDGSVWRFIITFIIFLPLLTGHYATDTYNIANVGYEKYAINWSLIDGRIFMGIIGLLASKINISIEAYVFITLSLALIISNIAVIVLNKIIKKYKQPKNKIQEIILLVISYITIFNFMYLENMYFVESIVMAISVLIFIISANILVNKNKYHIIKSLGLNIIGVMCYQGTIGLFFVYTILFTILKNKNNIKQIIIDIIKCGIIALISVLFNILSVKIIEVIFDLKQDRLGSTKKIFENIKKIIITIPRIIQEACNLFPVNALPTFLGILTLIVCIYQIKIFKEKNDNNILYKYLAIVFIAIAGCSVTYILAMTSFFAGRLRNALGALVGIIFILLYVETDLFEKKGKLNILTILTFITFVIINTINYENIMLQHKKVNKLEKQEIVELNNYIEQYEKQTGFKVTKIVKVPVSGQTTKGYFKGIKNKTSFTHNALKTSWASDGVINFYTTRNLKTIKTTKEQKEIYTKHGNQELEYQCINDTLYVRIYLF